MDSFISCALYVLMEGGHSYVSTRPRLRIFSKVSIRSPKDPEPGLGCCGVT